MSNKKAIVVLAEGFEEIEAVTIIDILRRAGIDVTVAGLYEKSIKGSHGITLLTDIVFNDKKDSYDACIFPGGMPGSINLATSDKLKNFVQSMNRKGKLVAAICAAPAVFLAPTGILKNKSATCYPGMQDNFEKDVAYKNEKVVVDENIITGQGPATAFLFSLTIVQKLVGKDIADNVRKKTLVF